MIVLISLIFLVGLAVGSFLNVVVYRVLAGESPLTGRSRCPLCRRQIPWYDLIPLVSFFYLRGRCRFCHRNISWQYPVLECLTGILFVWWYGVGSVFFRLTEHPHLFIQRGFWLLTGTLLLSLSVADAFYHVLPDLFTVGLGLTTLAYRSWLTVSGVMQGKDLAMFILSGVGASLFFLSLRLLTRGKGMGWGDVKLAFGLGVLLGWPRLVVALGVAFLTGASVGLILVLVGKKRLREPIGFGPFLVAGTALALVWGERLWRMYASFAGF